MQITPYKNKIQIELEKPVAGALDLSSKQTAVECGTIVAIGEDIKRLKIGDKIFYKAWNLDCIGYQGENYYFMDEDASGICAIITE